MRVSRLSAIAAAIAVPLLLRTEARATETLTIATVDNPDMIVMQELSSHFEKDHPDIKLRWVPMDENTLRQRVTTEVATHAGQLDIVTVGIYEVPMWSRLGWLAPLTDIPASYDVDDVFAPLRAGLSHDGKLYALPFYGESTFTLYRSDLFRKAGLTMPDTPTWDQIATFARKIDDPTHGVYGICLRGKPGWGENIGFLTDMVNSFGGRWFDMKWQPQLTSPAWRKAVTLYVHMLKEDGPPGEVTGGYNENLALFASGKCGIWVDATVSASFLSDPKQSKVVGRVAYAQAPYETTRIGSHYLWSWTLAVPSTTPHLDAAKAFVTWATSPAYIELVAKERGWAAVPPGTRTSTYRNPAYLKAAPFAPAVLDAIQTADLHHPTLLPVPYVGIGYVGIPQFQAIGTNVGQIIAGALAGRQSVDAALAQAQDATRRTMQEAGYYR